MPATVTSPNMGIVVPVALQQLGPAWATNIQTAFFTTLDGHNHTPGNGMQIPTAGLNINADLGFQLNNVTQLRSARFSSNGAPLNGGSDTGCAYNVLGDLYWNNGAGSAIQVTKSGLVNSTFTSYNTKTAVSGNYTILSTDTFQLYLVDTSGGPVTINLPAANAVGLGRLYVFRDIANNAQNNNITIVRSGTDHINAAAANFVVNSSGAECVMNGDGTSNWYANLTALTLTSTLLAPVVGTVRTITASYTVDNSGPDYTIYLNASVAINVTLPAPTTGRTIILEDVTGNLETNNVSLVRHGTENVNGIAGTRLLRTNWGRWTITSPDGVNWTCVGCGKLTKQVFTGNGTFTTFEAIEAIVVAWGGGGGAGTGASGVATTVTGGGGGGGSLGQVAPVSLPANTGTSVTVGAGGPGGAAGTGNNGSNGGDTIFGALLTAPGASGGFGGNALGTSVDQYLVGGGMPYRAGDGVHSIWNVLATNPQAGSTGFSTTGALIVEASGGFAATHDQGAQGGVNPWGAPGGAGGGVGSSGGGAGGGGGPGSVIGVTSSGGAGTSGAGAGGSAAGASPAANSGAGGGGSGACTSGTPGAGGNGGSGCLIVFWVD